MGVRGLQSRAMLRSALFACVFVVTACSGGDAPASADASRADVVEVSLGADDVAADVPSLHDASADTAAPDDVTPTDAPACSGRAGARGNITLRITSNGRERTAVVHVPSSYDASRAMPVVMDFHGWLGDGAAQASMTQLQREADARGVISVHADGLGRSWNAGVCCTPSSASGVDDVRFVRDLLDRVESDWCVDGRRIYAMGFSNGSALSHRLACELSERIAAIGPVSGTFAVPTCTPRRAVPVLHTHGTLDFVVPYNGGSVGGFEAVMATISRWAMVDGCTDAPAESYRRGSARCMTQSRCRGGSEVTLCTITNGIHAWPDNDDFRATAYILDFFARHPMP